MALLLVKQKGHETKSFPITGGTITIGRAGANHIVLANKYASGRHCEIRCEDGRCTVHDLNSTNGVFANGTKVSMKVLDDGDRILAGAAMLVFVADEESISIESLISQLGHADASRRELAANLLGQLGAAAAGDALMKLLRKETDVKVQSAAVEAIGFLGETKAAKALLALFDTKDVVLRSAVVKAIIRIADEKTVTELAHSLKHAEKRVRVLAAYVLGQIRGAHASKQLRRALDDESFEVREAVVKALGDSGDLQSVDALIESAKDTQRYPLVWVLDSLGKIESPKAFPILSGALAERNVEVRMAAIDGIGRLRLKEGVPALIPLLDDSDARIRRCAAGSLEKLKAAIERERKLASRSGEVRKTIEISAIGEDESGSAKSAFREDKAAWEQWWAKQAAE
ncbi:MAG: FHA domain-containing protein [Candidatus Abyssobacteria bacterium SURF_5]|uniref:FHA domain-containing protein n=1 Tax=Abyssobacteria bacterium (strain SURF_5) TaxID=2093360 RepID=A0A3A4N3Y5_ABYX5|nr:MAG: FHA domain-containing protein [Candidatus Abyssubacteria bacterium SURF_5]